MKPTTLILSSFLIGVSSFAAASSSASSAEALAKEETSAQQGRPNILFAIADDCC